MKYMVKCAYCEKTFVVDTNTNDAEFICDSCGGKSSKENIVREIVPQKKVVYMSSNREENAAWDAIKSFNLSEHEGKEGFIDQLRDSFEEEPKAGGKSDGAWILKLIMAVGMGIMVLVICALYMLWS